jgi:hypothetical protein
MRLQMQVHGIVTYTKRCANALQCYPEAGGQARAKLWLVMNFHLVSNHRALVIAQRFDFGDRKISIVEFG